MMAIADNDQDTLLMDGFLANLNTDLLKHIGPWEMSK